MLRASATNRWTNCTWFSTHHFADTPGGAAAQKGQRVHAAIAAALGSTESLKAEGPDELAMASTGLAYANALRTEFPSYTMLVEQLLERVGIKGTVDLALVGPDNAVLVDWKTGQRHEGYEPQMLTYALLLRSVYPALSRITVRLVYLAIGEVDEVVFDAARIDEHNDAVMIATSRREEEAPTATPGQWCQWCPGKLQGCPAYASDEAALATTDHSLAVALPSLIAPIVDASVARAAAKFLGFAKESLELIEANLKTYVRDGGGKLLLDDGRTYRVFSTSRTTLATTPEVLSLLAANGCAAVIKQTAAWSDVKKALKDSPGTFAGLESQLETINAIKTTEYETWKMT